MAAKKSKKGCDCIKKVNKMMKPRGYAVHHTLGVGGAPQMVALDLVKIDDLKPRRGSSILVASYCPFCGKEYPEVN